MDVLRLKCLVYSSIHMEWAIGDHALTGHSLRFVVGGAAGRVFEGWLGPGRVTRVPCWPVAQGSSELPGWRRCVPQTYGLWEVGKGQPGWSLSANP